MAKLLKIFLVILVLVFTACKDSGKTSEKFKEDPEPIIQDALKNKKYLILVFESESCKYCDMLNREVLFQPDFKQKAKENNVNVAIINVYGDRKITDPETKQKMEESALAVANRVYSYPTILVYDPNQDFKVVFRQNGVIMKKDFINFLEYLGSGCYPKVEFEEFINNGKKC
ncbi:MAG: thioredoxin fold domain-containing protein [Aquificae bacterium]|nr:thioredoxin fold domain-containing protein [Aquificota bacterium]